MSDKEAQVDWDDDGFLDIDECYDKIRQLRAELARCHALAALVTPELPALLERLAQYANLYDAPESAYDARALAARIREALAQEANDD